MKKTIISILFILSPFLFCQSAFAEDIQISLSYQTTDSRTIIRSSKYVIKGPDYFDWHWCTGGSWSRDTCDIDRIQNAKKGIYTVRGAVLGEWSETSKGANTDISYTLHITSSSGSVQETRQGIIRSSRDGEKSGYPGSVLFTFSL